MSQEAVVGTKPPVSHEEIIHKIVEQKLPKNPGVDEFLNKSGAEIAATVNQMFTTIQLLGKEGVMACMLLQAAEAYGTHWQAEQDVYDAIFETERGFGRLIFAMSMLFTGKQLPEAQQFMQSLQPPEESGILQAQ